MANTYRYFHLYRAFVFPFNPILADVNDFELELRLYLKSLDTGELSDPLKESHRWTDDKYLGQIGLILATMASGVQFSNLSHVSRAHISRDLSMWNEYPANQACTNRRDSSQGFPIASTC